MSRFVGVLFVLAACSGPTVVGDLTIDSIVPNVGPTTAPTAFRIEGKNFERPVRSNVDNGATKIDDIALTVGDQVIADARWIDESTLEGTVPAGMALGQYDVVVRLGSRSSTVMNGFTISDAPLTGPDAGIDGQTGPPSPYQMTGVHWALPCVVNYVDHSCSTAAFMTSSQTLTGLASEHWRVTVHVRGVMENDTYAGGTAPGGGWYHGDPNPLTGAIPTEPNQNFYGFIVSSPSQVYYLNYGATLIGTNALAWDYTATFDIDGNATIDYIGGGTDFYQWGNYDPATMQPYPANGVVTVLTPFPGQYAHLDILQVTALP